MFGFLKNVEGKAVISNRIFETVLYNLFLSEEYVGSRMYDAGLLDKNQFVVNGHLNVRRVLERFVESFVHQQPVSQDNLLYAHFLLLVKAEAEHVSFFQMKVIQIGRQLLLASLVIGISPPDLQL